MGGGWAPGWGGHHDLHPHPCQLRCLGGFGVLLFREPPCPAALPLSPEGECGEVTASTLPLNPRLFLTCPHERSVALDRGR